MKFRLNKNATIESCEAASILLAQTPADVTVDLIIPMELKHSSTGGEMAWAQLVLAWSARSSAGKLITYFKDVEHLRERGRDSFRYLPQLLAGLSGKQVFAQDQETDLTKETLKICLEQLATLQSNNPRENSRGRHFQVLAADHLGRSHPVFLYKKNEYGYRELRSRRKFVDLAGYLLEAMSARRFENTDLVDIERSIGNLLFETFKNTEDHGMLNEYGVPLESSFRCFQASSFGQDGEALETATKGFDPAWNYISSLSDAKSKQQTTFLRISILDSGVGYAVTWSGKPLSSMSLEDELNFTKECFTNATSKSHDRFGHGLVLLGKILQKHRGFLWLRTGRTSLYYNGNDGLVDGSFQESLQSWSPENLEACAAAVGTHLMVLIPLPRAE